MRRIDQMKIEIMPIAIETNLHQLRKDGNPIKTIKNNLLLSNLNTSSHQCLKNPTIKPPCKICLTIHISPFKLLNRT